MAAALFLGVPSLVAAGHYKHTPWWALPGIALAAIFFLVAVFIIVAPWLFRRSPPAVPGPPALPPAPVDVSVVHKADGDRLRLVVTNEGPRGGFTAEVISVLDPDGRPVERQSWTVPWVGDDSAAPADLLHSGSRTLDFARFVPDEGQWPHRAFWEFFSLPGPGRIAVMYKPVADKRELAPARFVVTVRIIRSEPSPDHTDRQFAIGVTSNAGLVCEPAEW